MIPTGRPKARSQDEPPGTSTVPFSPAPPKRARKRLEIGLVNNMGDQALKATERQFKGLVSAAASDLDLRFRVFALKGIHRSASARDYIAAHYEPASAILGSELQALIITGAQPQADRLDEEPYWEELVELIDWAKFNTTSTILSCLAAHAAVLHLDGIQRRRLVNKCAGVFAFTTKRTHPLVGRKGSDRIIPHSRHNDLLEPELEQSGYSVLTASPTYGVDTFIKSFGSQFVFLQGHPEYEANSLAREYRRDVSLYLRRETDRMPTWPGGYFDRHAEVALREIEQLGFDEAALSGHHLYKIDSLTPVRAAWRDTAVSFFQKWLDLIVNGFGGAEADSTNVEVHEFATP